MDWAVIGAWFWEYADDLTAMLLYGFAGIISNCVYRGGLRKQWNGLAAHGDAVNTVAFGLLSAVASHSLIIGFALAAGLFAGAAPAIFKETADKYLAERNVRGWVSIVAARGFVWGFPMAFLTAPLIGMPSMLFLTLAFVMPAAYSYVWWYKGGNQIVNTWTLSEMTFGFYYFALVKVIFILFHVKHFYILTGIPVI